MKGQPGSRKNVEGGGSGPGPRALCVMGMHRSGTSMITRLLQLAGLYLGDEADLMPATTDNQDGFWENLKFVRVNDQLLNELGGGWDYPVSFPQQWATDARLLPVKNAAESVVAEFVGRDHWGWKDPRSSLVLPFWQTVALRSTTIALSAR